eukprot:260905_1
MSYFLCLISYSWKNVYLQMFLLLLSLLFRAAICAFIELKRQDILKTNPKITKGIVINKTTMDCIKSCVAEMDDDYSIKYVFNSNQTDLKLTFVTDMNKYIPPIIINLIKSFIGDIYHYNSNSIITTYDVEKREYMLFEIGQIIDVLFDQSHPKSYNEPKIIFDHRINHRYKHERDRKQSKCGILCLFVLPTCATGLLYGIFKDLNVCQNGKEHIFVACANILLLIVITIIVHCILLMILYPIFSWIYNCHWPLIDSMSNIKLKIIPANNK